MQHHTDTEPTDRFPTDATGLPRRARPSWSSWLTVSISICGSLRSPSDWATRRSDAGLQRVDSRTDLEDAGGRGGNRRRQEPGRHRRHGSLAWVAAGEPLRRDARDASADGRGRKVLRARHVPRSGPYWYHPHIREDYGQEMGLYGNILVEPADPDYWPPAHRDLVLTLDDILLEDGKIAPASAPRKRHMRRWAGSAT